MTKYNAIGLTNQNVTVTFDLTNPVPLTEKKAEKLNEMLPDMLEVSVEGGDIYDEIEIDEGFEEGVYTNDCVVSFTVPSQVELMVEYEPPVKWYSNGDPGDPGYYDFEVIGGEITISSSQMERNLKLLPYIGEFIKNVKVRVSDIEENDIEVTDW